MWQGKSKHKQVQELLEGYVLEEKKEHVHNDWLLVGKADAYNEDHILEIKTGDTIKDKAKEWHEYQARIYCSMFERPICYIVQPVVKSERIILKTIGEIKRNDNWLQKRLEIIDGFHKELQELQEPHGNE